MIKTALHKIFSISLALVVLFSTFSFKVEKHFCGDNLVDVAIFSDVKGCGMEMCKVSSKKKSCCKNEVEIIKGQDDLKLDNFEDFALNHQFFIASFFYAYVNLFESLPNQIIPHKNYRPPNLVHDIQLLDDVFLI